MVFICYLNVTFSMLWTAGKYEITDLIYRPAGKGKKAEEELRTVGEGHGRRLNIQLHIRYSPFTSL